MTISQEQQEDINNSKFAKQNTTTRPTVPALENILFEAFPVLDHGFVRVVDYMGDDSAVVQAARVSYGKGTKKASEDVALIRYLMRHRHSSPFEMCSIKLHVKLPIFIARQWIRHRTASVNEYSARYSVMNKEFYLPNAENLAPQSSANHQGRGANTLSNEESEHVLQLLKADAEYCYEDYVDMLNHDEDGNILHPDKCGLARELARMNLTLNYYTEWYWKIDLHNLFHFLELRSDSHAQYEIREYANTILNIVKLWTPASYDAFMEYRVGGVTLSKSGLEVVRALIRGGMSDGEGMSKREFSELMELIR